MNPKKMHGVKRKLVPRHGSESEQSPEIPRKLATHRGAAGDGIRPCKGQAVYVHTEHHAWTEGMVIDSDHSNNMVTVQMDNSEQVVSCCASHVLLCSEKSAEELNNLTHISPVHEASVLSCLHKRFTQGRYYTNAGTTVIAVNPFTDVSHLYTLQQIHAYHSRIHGLPPHIYPVAETAYSSLVRELGKVNQSVIISGESGAGKTVTTKHLVRYLTVITSGISEGSSSDVTGDKIEQRILDSNPVLEAFGNAATPRNNNSSRFGKFIELQFLRMGQIKGGSIQTYLLEKTRVMHQGQGENNFHIFYQMTGLADEDENFPDWLLDIKQEVTDNMFTCVPHNQDCSERGDIRDTLSAMTNIGLDQQQQKKVFEILMAILYLGNIAFVQAKDDASDLESSIDSWDSFGSDGSFVEVSVSEAALGRSCLLLGLDPEGLKQTLLHRSLAAGSGHRHSVFIKPIGLAEARSRRDCLAMLLYSRLFEWLVGFINKQIKADFHDNVIGLLDIYGFEVFSVNSLEQLCINYANERLQQHYIAHFLESLQKEYSEECLDWVPVDCSDNRPCVNILHGRVSVFSLLNEEVYLNRQSDDVAVQGRLLQLSAGSQSYLSPPSSQGLSGRQPAFVVRHYAGHVHYTISHLVTKNKDDIPPDLVSLLTSSDHDFVHQLFASYSEPESPAGRKKKTVLTKFKSSLDDLISSMLDSDMHYIRCLKPNSSSQQGIFQRPYILQQLRACGIIETVDICRNSYPARMTYVEFQQRYSMLLRWRVAQGQGQPGQKVKVRGSDLCDPLDLLLHQQLHLPVSPKRTPTPKIRRRTGLTREDHGRKVCASILQTALPDPENIHLQQQFGRTKIFLTESQLEHLECGRQSVLTHSAVVIQSAWRGECCRRQYRRMVAASLVWRWWVAARTRRQFLTLRQAAVTLQTGIRKWLHQVRLRRKPVTPPPSEVDGTPPPTEAPSTPEEKPCSPPRPHPAPTSASVSPSSSPSSSPSPGVGGDGNLSDDSGVMLHEPVLHQGGQSQKKRVADCLQSAQKRQRLMEAARQVARLAGIHFGDGLVTRRRIPKFGCRFHTKTTPLQYSHLTNRRDLPQGLADVLEDLDDQCPSPLSGEVGSSVDPH